MSPTARALRNTTVTVLVAHDDPLGEGVERASQADGVRRRLGHSFGGPVGDELEVVQGGLDAHAVVLGRGVDTEARRQGRQALLQGPPTGPAPEDGGHHDADDGQRAERAKPATTKLDETVLAASTAQA